jgi:hypothetical protein
MISIKDGRVKKTGLKIGYSFILVSVFVLVYTCLWPAFWNLVILPKASSDTRGVRIELFKEGRLFNSTA